MAEYTDTEAQDIAGEIMAALAEIEEPVDDAGLLNLIASVLSIELDTIRDSRFDDGDTAGWERGYTEGYDDAEKELAAPLGCNRRESIRARGWAFRLAEAGIDAETIAMAEDERVLVALDEQEISRVLKVLATAS